MLPLRFAVRKRSAGKFGVQYTVISWCRLETGGGCGIYGHCNRNGEINAVPNFWATSKLIRRNARRAVDTVT